MNIREAWSQYKSRDKLPEPVVSALDAWVTYPSSESEQVSLLWGELLERQLHTLSYLPFREAVSQLSRNYFLAVRPWRSQNLGARYSESFETLVPNLKTDEVSLSALFENIPDLDRHEALFHNAVLIALWLEAVKEGEVASTVVSNASRFYLDGDFAIEIEANSISQDLMNSAFELRFIQGSLKTMRGATGLGSDVAGGG